MENSWKIRKKIPKRISDELGNYPSIIRQLLFNRGIITFEQAEIFLKSNFEEGLHSPFLFLDMQKASARIRTAVEKQETVFVYGDYDADAVTASAVLIQALDFLGLKAQSYIPDRFTEGYGVNMEALEKIKTQGASLIITVDCGTNSVDAAEFCRKSGIDFIITDHHEILGEIPKAYAVINPKNPRENYPNRDLTGVGVAYKLACAFLGTNSKWHKWLLDLVAVGTVADCHNLVAENRILVKYGLKVLPKTKWVGMRSLLGSAGVDVGSKQPDTYTLGFVIAPRLNAAGRLEHASIALNLLLEKDSVSAQERAMALEAINQKRQVLTMNVLSEAREQALKLGDKKLLLLYGKGWPKGVVGLVAGRIAEEFGKPAIVLEESENQAIGSARTFGEFDVLEAIGSAKEYLSKYGGHKQAAGLSLDVSNLENFYRKILAFCEQDSILGRQKKELTAEAVIEPEDLNSDFFNYLVQFEPFGVGNLQPKFLIPGIKVISGKKVGKNGNHLQFRFDFGGKIFSGIAFNFGDFEKKYKIGDTLDMVAEIIKDEWSGGFKFKVVSFRPI